MAVIYTKFLENILAIHENLQNKIPYPFFDKACIRYEVLRSVLVDGKDINSAIQMFGVTRYEYFKSVSLFNEYGVAGLVIFTFKQLIEDFPLEVERMVFVLKQAKSDIPATKMSLIIKGFKYDININLMRRLYASYGWAHGTKSYKDINFFTLNLKVIKLNKINNWRIKRTSFFDKKDKLQNLLEIFRTIEDRGITKRYPGSRVSLTMHKTNFLSIGLLGLLDSERPSFRNSKLGLSEEGSIVLSKIQNPGKGNNHYLKILKSKKINVDSTCLTKIFNRWKVNEFQSQFIGEIRRLSEDEEIKILPKENLPNSSPTRLDRGFISFITNLDFVPLANPGIFLFLPYLNQLKIYEKASTFMELDPEKGYSWFSLLLLNLGRILEGISSTWKACHKHELSLPLFAGLVTMPCVDTILNNLASISESDLFQLRQYLTQMASQKKLIKGKRIAFDFQMKDFTGDDVNLKNIGKGPSPKRKICFPGFRPHIAWDVDTGVPIALEFRNGKSRATTTVKRFIRELLIQPLGEQSIEHIYVDSEYTAEHVWRFIVDMETGLGADLTMCIKRNKRVKKFIDAFLQTNPTWLYYDEKHTYTEQTFSIPIRDTDKILQCVLKREEKNGNLRCFGSTKKGLSAREILYDYGDRWRVETGIKDLTENYFLNNTPGIDPHSINVHYFIVTLARILFEMFSQDYEDSLNADMSKKGIGTIRPEFLVSSNAKLYRDGNILIIKWEDHYPEKKNKIIKNLFEKLNKNSQQGIPFLGGLQLKFEIVQPRSKNLRNQLKRDKL